jgi:hypothetical protein
VEAQRNARQKHVARAERQLEAGAEEDEEAGRNGGRRLTPWRRAGDAVGDPRELVLDGVRRQVVLLRATASTPTARHLVAPPRSLSSR